MPKKVRPIPKGYHTVTASLTQADSGRTIVFCKQAFGAKERMRVLGPGGKIMHAEIRVGNSLIMLNDEMGGFKSAKALGASPISLWLYVDDCDALFKRAVAAGATVQPGPMGEPADQFWGDRCGAIIDPEGYTRTIATRKEDLTPEELNQRAQEFFKSFAGAQK